ncbi:arginase family protein [Heyndrickxia coagulans]|uniref:arginase family protein n=1 Tax=Heyndrickxia TaxID=2837504 RepID=UPI001378BE79|nr:MULTISPECIES: arginase family protein [Heyndrickxia]MEC2225046.1 arginase family protein [Weizmannia sp. CD-2023]MED4966585.1 arginase family protein [Heyndrickxia coagulans]NCG69226.1 hypothetical protein [Heyndrickxia coagulans]
MLTLNKEIISLKKVNDYYHLNNIITGQGIEINKETLEFIRGFEAELSLKDIEGKFGLDLNESKNIIETLVMLGFLKNSQVSENVEIINNSLFEKRNKNNLFFDSSSEPSNEYQIGLLGIPYDGAVTGIPGTKLAPDNIRQFTSGYTSNITNIDGVEKVYTLSSALYNQQLTFDLGNILYIPGESSSSLHKRIETAYRFLKKSFKQVFFAIGGDHSITTPILKSFDEEITLVKIDAHYDSVIPFKNQPINHNNFINYVREIENITEIIHIGVREPLTPSMILKNDKVITSEEIIHTQWKEKLERSINRNNSIYISIDIDVLDPSESQGTGYLVPFGLKLNHLIEVINFLTGYKVIGVDLVEFNPLLDKNNQTMYVLLNVIENTIKKLVKKEILL